MTSTLIAINEAGYRIGQGHHNSTISDARVQVVRDLREHQRLSVREIAARLSMSRHTVRRICDYSRRGQVAWTWRRVSQDPEE